MKNKFISLLMAISLISSFLVFPVQAQDSIIESENVAYAIMGEKLISKNFASFKVGAQADNKQISERAGAGCWIIDKANGLSSDKLCMVLDNEFKSGVANGDAYIIEVDYFDVSKGGFFFLAYDGQRLKQQNEYWSMAEQKVIYTEGTERWKTATFRIDDAKFEKTLEGSCDLFIGTRLSDALNDPNYLSEIPIPFKAVRITKVPGANPVRNVVSVDNVGNTFAWYDESKVVHNTFTNLLDKKVSYDITFELENIDGYIAYSKTETVEFEAEEEKKFDFEFGEFERCDRYNYFVTVKNEELGINSRVQYSVVAIIKADPDGIKNEHMGFCGPGYSNQSLTSEENYDLALSLMRLGGFNASRYDEGWHSRDNGSRGVDTKAKQEVVLSKTAEHDLGTLAILYFGNNEVTGGWNWMPDTDEEHAEAEKFAEEFIKHLADKTDSYEAWNEPDLNYFAQNFSTKDYVRMYSMLAEKIEKYDPTAKIGYLCYASGGSQISKDYTTEMLEMGLDEMIRGNAITFHGYPNPNAETFNSEVKIKWYIEELKKFGVERDEYEIWTTEYGGTVADEHVGTRKRLGAVTLRETLLQRMECDVDRFYVYRFEDPGNLTYRREASFGHVSSSNGYARIYGQICVPWESYVMLTAYNYLFADTEPQEYIAKEDNLRIYKFRSNKFGKDIIALNSVSGAETVTLNLGAGEIQYFDEYGNDTILTSEDGIYTFSATEYPHYILGDFNNAELIKNGDKFVFNGYIEAVSGDIARINIKNATNKEYDIQFDMAEGNKLSENAKLVCGDNEIKIFNSAEIDKEYETRILIKDGDKTVAILPIQIKSVPIVVTQMSLQLKNPANFNKWQGVVRIENTSDTKVLRGKFEVIGPEKFKTKTPIDISFVPKKKTAEISFDLPEITKKQIYTFEYKLTLDNGDVYTGEAKADTTCASYATSVPKIDGIIDENEWNAQTLMQASTIENAVIPESWKGAEDLSTKAYAMWDEEKVYFCWDVADDAFSQENDGFYTWQGDSVQFGVYMGSGDEYIALGEANGKFTEIGIAKTPKGPQVYRFSAQDSNSHPTGLLEADDYKLAVTVGEKRTIYELALPWNTLLPEGIRPKANSRLGFSYLVNDNDGQGRKGGVQFASGIYYTKDSSLFTYINLIGKN